MLSVGTEPRWHSCQTVKKPEVGSSAYHFFVQCAHMIRPQLQPRDPNIRSGGLPRVLALLPQWSTRLGLTSLAQVPSCTMGVACILR
jgi:hypothetical protein